MLSTAQLTSMRATLTGSLPDTCQIGRYTEVADGGGGMTVTYPLDDAVACRATPDPATIRSAEAVVGGAEATDTPWTFTFASDLAVDEKDRLLYDGRTFEVTAVGTPRTWQLDVRVLARLVVPS